MIISVRRTTTMIISNRQTITIKISIRKTTAMKISDGIASLKRCGHEKSDSVTTFQKTVSQSLNTSDFTFISDTAIVII